MYNLYSIYSIYTDICYHFFNHFHIYFIQSSWEPIDKDRSESVPKIHKID